MELKLPDRLYRRQGHFLLIVPYGIETALTLSRQYRAFPLLIVPYGIETVT